MHRCYCKDLDLNQPVLFLKDTKEIHHLKDVLRLKEKTELHLFNDAGDQAKGFITTITNNEILITITQKLKPEEAQINIILACAMPKKGKFELIIEKATELGVSEIIPLRTQRTEVILKGARLEKKYERFTTVAINAVKQCKRNTIPKIHPITSFTDCINDLTQRASVFIPSLQESSKKLDETLPKFAKAKTIAFFIGPEGDLTSEEYS
ncbi:MAG: 16S rRNA (uracil1498-N3)-methyltransferase, partial [Candidatus Omnitrophota bacterium]